VLLYRLKWAQLNTIIDTKNLKILDFGSGFGTTANHLAENNEVIAIEPREDMIEERERDNKYTQIHGKIEKIKDFADRSFDAVICHNVLEFAAERAEIVKEFSRVLKSKGILSVVKNNGSGRIMSKVVAEYNVDEALDLLDGGHIANIFGRVNLYAPEDLEKWGGDLKIEKKLGLQTFFALQQNNEIKKEPEWIDKMFEIEMRTCDMEPFKSISLYHHIILSKT
jgi:SAM-dependent methyltransferase